MTNYFTKSDVAWLAWTVFLCLLVSIVQMYSRDITIDKVHRTEFNLLYKIFNENTIDRHNLQSTLEPLLTERRFALFQVAIISEDSCSENTKHYYNNPLLCTTFQDSKNLMPYTSLTEFETSDIIQEKISGSYLIKKFTDSNEYLIAKTNFYSKDSELSKFIYFIANRYYQANGYRKIYEKGKFLFITIFFTSFIIWILTKLQYKKYRDNYNASIKKENDLQSKIDDIDTKYNELKNKKYENDIMLEEFELKFKTSNFQSDAQKKELETIINTLTTSKNELEKLLKEDENLIETLEREAIELRKMVHLQLNKLEYHEQKEKNDSIYNKLENLEKLWRHEPTWKDRKHIESLVSLKDAHLPFTITQGFIAFDKLVFNLAKQYDIYLVESQTNLINNINIIFNNGLLPLKYEQNFHNIRKARNKWFHAGIYPTIETIDFLINLLQDTDAEVFI